MDLILQSTDHRRQSWGLMGRDPQILGGGSQGVAGDVDGSLKIGLPFPTLHRKWDFPEKRKN